MNKLNILLVEDESLVALELSRRITKYEGHFVQCATTVNKANDLMLKETIDLILMDINLGNSVSGIDLYNSFNTNIPVIYLTAYQDENTISEAVKTEPLGYLIKPYNEKDLSTLLKMANYKITKNKLKQKKNYLLNIGDEYFFNIEENKLFFKEEYIKLSKKELLLLNLLIQGKGQVLSFKTIEDELWQDNPPSSSSMRTMIYRLRKKLNHKLITTEFDYGIKLVK